MSFIQEKTNGLTSLQEQYKEFWLYFNAISSQHIVFPQEFKCHPIPSIRCYQDYSIGKPYHLVVKINLTKNQIAIGAYFNDVVKYDEFYRYKDNIVNSLNMELGWIKHSTKGSAFMVLPANLYDKSQWIIICEIIIAKMIDIKKVFNSLSI